MSRRKRPTRRYRHPGCGRPAAGEAARRRPVRSRPPLAEAFPAIDGQTGTSLRYDVVDVFTRRAYGGNPLAVVHGAAALTGAQMRAMAREFNLSETAFVLPPTTADATYRLRIFSPAGELPFAGHPSIGAAAALLRRGRIAAGEVVMECGAGLRRLRLEDSGRAVLDGGVPVLGTPVAPGPLLRAVGLTATDLAGPTPRTVECGLIFPYLAVQPDAIRRARPPSDGTRDVVAVLHWDAGRRAAHARVFLPGHGVPEDAASGSAALGLGAWLLAAGLLPGDGISAYTVHQGAELGRPSTLECTVTASGGVPVATTVAGQVITIATGEIRTPPTTAT